LTHLADPPAFFSTLTPGGSPCCCSFRVRCALKRVAAKAEHARYGATTGIRITVASGLYRAEATDGRRAVVVQGLVPIEDPPWPGFKEVPDDACEAIVLPKDLERACKVGDQFVQSRFDMVGMATVGDGVLCLGLGTDLVTARTVEGRFPQIDKVMPQKRPLFTFRIDPKLTAETLLTIAELLPDDARGVQCFYYGDGYPLGFCAQNPENGMMIDALVVPLSLAQEPEKPEPAEAAQPDAEQSELEQPDAEQDAEPKPKRRGRKLAIAQPEANGEQDAPPAANAQDSGGQDAPPPEASIGQAKSRKKSKKVAV
jgi:hypothetical protein